MKMEKEVPVLMEVVKEAMVTDNILTLAKTLNLFV
jgi:hypothetical protein